MEALKTISYELVEQSGIPDWVAVAMGSGVTLYSLWKGFNELEEAGKIDSKPRLIGVQAEGCAPIADAFNNHIEEPLNLEAGDTIATAIRVAKPIFGAAALSALKESDGLSVTVPDSAMINYGKEIARHEGIFDEPASAASVAFIPELLKRARTIFLSYHFYYSYTFKGNFKYFSRGTTISIVMGFCFP